MMSHKKIVSALALGLAVLPGLIFAQEVGVTTKAANANATRTAVSATRQQRIQTQATKLLERLNQEVDLLTGILTRLDSRIGKMSAVATSTALTAAQTTVTEARTLLADAKNSFADLETEILAAASSTKPRQSYQPVKSAIKVAIQEINQARAKIGAAIKSLILINQ